MGVSAVRNCYRWISECDTGERVSVTGEDEIVSPEDAMHLRWVTCSGVSGCV